MEACAIVIWPGLAWGWVPIGGSFVGVSISPCKRGQWQVLAFSIRTHTHTLVQWVYNGARSERVDYLYVHCLNIIITLDN